MIYLRCSYLFNQLQFIIIRLIIILSKGYFRLDQWRIFFFGVYHFIIKKILFPIYTLMSIWSLFICSLARNLQSEIFCVVYRMVYQVNAHLLFYFSYCLGSNRQDTTNKSHTIRNTLFPQLPNNFLSFVANKMNSTSLFSFF